MATKRLGIERPSLDGMTDEQLQYQRFLETAMVMGNAQEVKSTFDPRTWPISTHIAIVTAVLTAFAWAFSSGGEWRDLSQRVQAIEARQTQDSVIYARRDLIEQQMGYVVIGLNELKVKVDQLTAARGNGR